MSDAVYAVIAYIARYWFTFLAVIIIWRAIIWLRKDADRLSRVRRRLPDAGYIGEWAVVASDAPGVPAGMVLRAPRDGWVGSARACDIRLRDAGVPARAARFYLRPDGLHLLPQRSNQVLVDGETVQREAILRHGATMTVGGVTLQLRLFAGVLLSGETPVGRRQRRGQRLLPLPDEAIIPETDEDDEAILEAIEAEIEEEPEALPPLELPKPALIIRTRKGRRR